MNRHIWHKGLALLCAVLTVTATLLTGCGGKEEKQWHDHDTVAVMDIAYTNEAEGTLALTVKDCQGNLLYTKTGLTKKGLVHNVTDTVVSLSWVTSNNPGGYETVYIDRLHCRVSELIAGEQATDGTRLVHTTVKKDKLTVIVQDLFDKDAFCQETVLEEAYLGGEYTVLGARLVMEDQVNVSYLTDAEGMHRITAFPLYPDGKPTTEAKEPEATKETEKAAKTTKADKTEKTEK